MIGIILTLDLISIYIYIYIYGSVLNLLDANLKRGTDHI